MKAEQNERNRKAKSTSPQSLPRKHLQKIRLRGTHGSKKNKKSMLSFKCTFSPKLVVIFITTHATGNDRRARKEKDERVQWGKGAASRGGCLIHPSLFPCSILIGDE
jgi:hypothetical protein